MKKFLFEIFYTLLIISTFAAVVLIAIENQFDVQTVKSKDFHSWVQKNSPLIVDLREENERINDPIDYEPIFYISFLDLEKNLDQIELPHEPKILFVCSDGNRARLISSLLKNKYNNLYYLKSGLHPITFD
jgi:rhodanese-related sulfurtransferase